MQKFLKKERSRSDKKGALLLSKRKSCHRRDITGFLAIPDPLSVSIQEGEGCERQIRENGMAGTPLNRETHSLAASPQIRVTIT